MAGLRLRRPAGPPAAAQDAAPDEPSTRSSTSCVHCDDLTEAEAMALMTGAASRRRARRPASGAGRCSPRPSSPRTSSATPRWRRSRRPARSARPRRPGTTRCWRTAPRRRATCAPCSACNAAPRGGGSARRQSGNTLKLLDLRERRHPGTADSRCPSSTASVSGERRRPPEPQAQAVDRPLARRRYRLTTARSPSPASPLPRTPVGTTSTSALDQAVECPRRPSAHAEPPQRLLPPISACRPPRRRSRSRSWPHVRHRRRRTDNLMASRCVANPGDLGRLCSEHLEASPC